MSETKSALDIVDAFLGDIQLAFYDRDQASLELNLDRLQAFIEPFLAEIKVNPFEKFKLSPVQERMAMALFQKGGGCVSKDTLLNAMYFDKLNHEPHFKTVEVFICHLRKKLYPEYRIETVWGRGYRMTQDAGPRATYRMHNKWEQKEAA